MSLPASTPDEQTFLITEQLLVVYCEDCTIAFAITAQLFDNRARTQRSMYCPVGHEFRAGYDSPALGEAAPLPTSAPAAPPAPPAAVPLPPAPTTPTSAFTR